jgi:hypothetical protein
MKERIEEKMRIMQIWIYCSIRNVNFNLQAHLFVVLNVENFDIGSLLFAQGNRIYLFHVDNLP